MLQVIAVLKNYSKHMIESKVSEKIFLNNKVKVVWDTISSKNALELFHPYCKKIMKLLVKQKWMN